MRKGYVISTFDMVNVADLDLLDQVQQACDEVTVVVLGDDYAERLHGRAPVIPEDERHGLVSALRSTDEVVLCQQEDQLPRRGGPDATLYSDEQALVGKVDVVLTPTRRSASSQLRNALNHQALNHQAHTTSRSNDEDLSA